MQCRNDRMECKGIFPAHFRIHLPHYMQERLMKCPAISCYLPQRKQDWRQVCWHKNNFVVEGMRWQSYENAGRVLRYIRGKSQKHCIDILPALHIESIEPPFHIISPTNNGIVLNHRMKEPLQNHHRCYYQQCRTNSQIPLGRRKSTLLWCWLIEAAS